MSKLHLILAFHNHQPVGNFDHVLEDCYRKSYLPFLETLLDHPNLKVVLHYSGHLLQWIQQMHPEAFDILKTLVSTRRVEILSGGFYEPILSVLPEKDRTLQITELTKFIRRNLGYSSKGIWLAERVWEPQMPKFIADAGAEYLPIDDYHFMLTGLEEGDLFGYYITEDEGRKISVFPGSEKLRYLIPYKSVDEILSYFRSVHMRGGDPLLTMADDGEKFGVWPNSYKHCYEDRWLANFLTALEQNSDWIETTTFSEYHAKYQPLGRVYLPTASYREMGEWTLPSEAGLQYEYALEELNKIIGEKSVNLLRGGIWRSFMVKYPEANHIHKRMSMISRKVHSAVEKDPKKGRVALTELWKGQCNDAYWHGVFGGLYLPHLRSALFRHLLNAESAAEDINKKYPLIEHSDFDCDGFEDIVVGTKHLTVAVTEKGGSLTELSLKGRAVNILDALSRRPEAYHAKIAKAAGPCQNSTKTIHEQLTVKEDGLCDYLVYDEYRRASLLDHFLPAGTGLDDMVRSSHEELGDFIDGVYEMAVLRKGENVTLSFSREGRAQDNRLRVAKTIDLLPGGEVKVAYLIEGTFSGLFAIEMNLSLLGSPDALIRTGEKTVSIRSRDLHEQVKKFSILDGNLDLGIQFKFPEPVSLWHHPVETISLSEQGIERLYQGTAFLFVTDMELSGKKIISFNMNFTEGTR